MMGSFNFPKIVNARKVDDETKARMKYDEAMTKLKKKKKKKKKYEDEFSSEATSIAGSN